MSGPAVKGTARLLVSAGSAKPSPKIGQALGPLGVNMAEFCKRFNEQTLSLRPSAVMRVRLTAFEDRSFAFDVLPPSTAWFLKRVTGRAKGAATPGHETVGTVSVKALFEIARARQAADPRLQSEALEALTKSVAASARGMGFKLTR